MTAFAGLARDLCDEHEEVRTHTDQASGLRAIIAIHSTALGPAMGGTRFHPYARDQDALADVLNLSRGMSYKNALAGLNWGGGKAVIIGDPRPASEGGCKSADLLRAYGRFVQSLGGRYTTGCDVGTDVADMDVIAGECAFTAGRSQGNGGSGDSSVLTAYGVLQGMRACARSRWGGPSLRGRRVGIAGVGKVGARLVSHLLDEGARVVVTDLRPDLVARVRAQYPQIEAVPDVDALIRADLDVYAPCALGGTLNDRTVPELSAEVVCGAANNQLARPDVAGALSARGILYAPDYLVNSGGVIQVAQAVAGGSFARAKAETRQIYTTATEIFDRAARLGITPSAAADRVARERIAAAGLRSGRCQPRGGAR